MAGPSNGMTVLPQFQGDYYQLQNQQALAQAMMSQAMQNRAPQQTVGSGQYQVMPKMSPLSGLSQLAEAYLGAKMGQNVAQGYRDMGQQQWAAFGGSPQQPAQSTQQAAPQSTDAGGMTGGQSGPGVQSYPVPSDGSAPQGAAPSAAAPSPQAGGSMQGSATPMNPLGMNPALAYMGYSADPGKYFETQAQAYKPAEITQQIRAAGYDPNSPLGQALARQMLNKNIAPDYVSGRPGGYMLNKSTGQLQWMPSVPEGGMPALDANGQPTGAVVTQPGAAGVMGATAAAKAGGQAQYQLTDAWDPTANGGQGGMVHQSVANAANSANGGGNPGMPLPLRNNNPGAVSPGGSVAQYPDMQTGLAAMDKNLASYANDPKVKTMGDAITKWVGSPPNAPAYIKDVSARLGIPPNTPIDLTNPAQRQALGTAIMLHENGPSSVFSSGGVRSAPQQQGGPMASQPPLGVTTAANTSQGAPSKLMADSYGSMSTADANYQQSREALTHMIDLANKKGASGSVIGVLPSQIGTKISGDAAEYQKSHANYVALQGKALGSGGTDASRATIEEAVPTYDKPQSAMVSGLNTQLNNLDLSHLKTQFLTPLYQNGNEKTYTQQSAAFDQNIKPAMIPTLQLSGNAQRAAVQSAIKANPSLRSSFEWAYNNGLLK